MRALERGHVSSKSPPRVQDGDEEVAGRNGRESSTPTGGKLMIFFFTKKETKKMSQYPDLPWNGCPSAKASQTLRTPDSACQNPRPRLLPFLPPNTVKKQTLEIMLPVFVKIATYKRLK